MYTDSHCHITCDRLYSRIDEIIENIKAKNLTSCMIMCTSPEELERAKKVKEKYPFFKIAFGWFPSDAKEVADKEIQYLIDQTPYLDCLGEIGLDYYWDTSFNDLQTVAIRRRICLWRIITFKLRMNTISLFLFICANPQKTAWIF